MAEDTIEEIAAHVHRLVDESDRRLSVELSERLSPVHRLGGAAPPAPQVGYSPFDIAILVAAGAIDFTSLAAGILVAPVASTHAVPTKGTAASLPLSDHDHGLSKGPPLAALAIAYSGPAVPIQVVRTDTPGGVVSTSVINYIGALVSSVVTTRSGYTITVTPTYTGTDITSISRAVA